MFTASIYPKGLEEQSGPVRSIRLPCNNGSVTGNSNTYFYPSFTKTASMAEAMFDGGDDSYLQWNPGFSNQYAKFHFSVTNYANLLSGKRILGVDFVVSYYIDQSQATDGYDFPTDMWLSNDTLTSFPDGSTFGIIQMSPLANSTTVTGLHTVRTRLGDANPTLGMTGGFSTYNPNIQQWTFTELQRFEGTAANRIFMLINSSYYPVAPLAIGATLQIYTAYLEVFYCEERRVAFGTRRIMGPTIASEFNTRSPFVLGANAIALRTPAGALSPSIASGEYVVTLSESNNGDALSALNTSKPYPILNEARQLYEIPSHEAVQVNIPFPLNEEIIGSTFTVESTDLLPQLTLHSPSGNPLTESHVYGRQSAAQVYSTNYVYQTIDDGVIGSLQTWPWIRFYARRFGATTAPLRVDCLNSPSLTGIGKQVEITPAEFDALDEILDGWKEIVLRFESPPQMGTGLNPTWRWSAFGETSGNRWEVLGAYAPAASGTAIYVVYSPFGPNSAFPQVPLTQRLNSATYGAPVSGASVYESWMPQWGPYYATATPDQSADVSVIFGPDMPVVTGFAVTQMSMPVTGIGQNCGIDPCGIPTAIHYNQLTWGPNTVTIYDTFDGPAVTGSLGSTNYGYSWATGTGTATQSTTGSSAFITSYSASPQGSVSPISGLVSKDQEVEIAFTAPALVPALAATSYITAEIRLRYTASEHYKFYMLLGPPNLPGSGTHYGSVNIDRNPSLTISAGAIDVPGIQYDATESSSWRLKAQALGGVLRAKAWNQRNNEPEEWTVATFDTGIPLTGGTVAVGFTINASNIPYTITLTEFKLNTVNEINEITYELQRSDEITDWQTIMLSDDPYIVSFKDYEARVGVETYYRIRRLSSYGFEGPWSDTVTTTMAAPGVSGSCLENAHVLIFTTNEHQNGGSNLAYSSVWESEVSEPFTFPEASFTQLQPMYDRNFFTAFRPTERGGEQFERTVLVQAAAIAPETLADFVSFRDLAWEDVSYVCVRDEDGNRWFASINVPSGVVRNRRRLYEATVQIVEVTDTASQVSP